MNSESKIEDKKDKQPSERKQDQQPTKDLNKSGSTPLNSHVANDHMRRPPSAREAQSHGAEHRTSPQHSPEVHFIGEVKFGLGFGPGVSCKWRIDHGKYWGVLEGAMEGHTQTSYGPEGSAAIWEHPFDAHYQTTSMQGWPKFMIQIQQLDSYGQVSVIAHGFAHIPCNPGTHEITVPCWRAIGTQEEELRGAV